jgi:hypothetical protein
MIGASRSPKLWIGGVLEGVNLNSAGEGVFEKRMAYKVSDHRTSQVPPLLIIRRRNSWDREDENARSGSFLLAL